MKYRIMQRSLYGVDVMKWAVDAAELRLWLQLIIETTIKGDELKKSPLLPNLNLNLRVGDSLVQEIGGISFNVRSNEIDAKLKKKLEELKKEKANYFENPQKAKYKSREDFHKQELKLFNSIIGSRINILQEENEIKIRGTETKQITLGAKTTTKAKKFDDKTNKKILSEIKENKKQIQNLRKMKKALKDSDKKPFVWEIDFAEIFGDKNGFDIVIGNPPYIMHENISPPNKIKSERLKKYKSEYKAKLTKSSKNLFPSIKKIDGKSDYYIYFFFHGLGLLNEKGTFCFITSNSWLDAKYGASLQEFLLNNVPIIGIYDNNKKRSFSHADINTVISLFGNPFVSYSNRELRSEEDTGLKIQDNTAKFVIFKKPYENVINSDNLIEIEETKADAGNELKDLLKNLVDKTNFRVFPIAQKDLLHDGWVYPEKYDLKRGRFKAGSYYGNKWNSKFLRAPKIFYTILEKGKFKNLESFGHIETYLNTGGADKFYFVDLIKRGDEYSEIENKEFNEKFKIETKFIQPMVKSPQELSKIYIEEKDLKSNIILLDEKEKTKNLFIEKYIEFGELKEYNRRSGPSNRSPWWKLPKQAREGGEILFPRNYNNRLLAFYNPKKYISNRFYRFKTTKHDKLIFILNSTLNILMMEIYGKTNLGEGALELGKPEIRLLPILKPNMDFTNNNILKRDSVTIFEECGFNNKKPFREQDPKPLPDRAELDNVIFDKLGLSEEERKEVYWSVCELVKQRLDKAKSLSG